MNLKEAKQITGGLALHLKCRAMHTTCRPGNA